MTDQIFIFVIAVTLAFAAGMIVGKPRGVYRPKPRQPLPHDVLAEPPRWRKRRDGSKRRIQAAD